MAYKIFNPPLLVDIMLEKYLQSIFWISISFCLNGASCRSVHGADTDGITGVDKIRLLGFTLSSDIDKNVHKNFKPTKPE